MAEKAISVRLDAEAQRALQILMRSGASQSEAIRGALLTASRQALYEQLEADAKRVGADPADRAEVAELLEFMDALSAPW
jgi:Arc/MetJ-type ribon-helix-helix transcriptional regulator